MPIGSNVADSYKKGRGLPMNKETMRARYGPQLEAEGMKNFSQFDGAEIMARDFGLSREDLDQYSLLSQQRTAAAQAAGLYDAEIAPMDTVMNVVDRETKEVRCALTRSCMHPTFVK